MADLLRSDVTVFRFARSIIAESLWWADDEDGLCWCDIDVGSIHRSPRTGNTDGTDDDIFLLDPPVSGFAQAGAGFIVAGAAAVTITDGVGAVQSELARITHRSDRLRLNEAKCDAEGRFVVGSMNLDGEPDGAIYSVDSVGRVITIVGGIAVANGFEWSEDGRRMWFTDTAVDTIYVGDYSMAGELTNVRPFASGRMSDGLTREADGGFWNGIYDTGRVVHWNSAGAIDQEVDVPAGHVTSVALGGVDRSTLYIATARENLTDRQLEDQPLTGSIFAVETSTHGFPVRAFAGTKGT